MERMRRHVEEHRVYRWAASLLAELAGARGTEGRGHSGVATADSRTVSRAALRSP